MRYPILLLLILWTAHAALAQDEPQPAPDAAAARAKEIRTLIEQLRHSDALKRTEAERKLTGIGRPALKPLREAWREASPEARTQLERILRGFGPGGTHVFSGGVRIVIGNKPGVTAETMEGSFRDPESGERIDYRLISDGGGVYKLDAGVTGRDGKSRRITDSGTLAALQKKHPFLTRFSFLGIGRERPARVPDGGKRFEGEGLIRITGRLPRGRALGHFGVRLQRPSRELAYHLELPEGAGYIVTEVLRGSPAARAGLRRYDVIVRLNGETLDDPRALDLNDERMVRKGVELEIVRRARPREIDVAAALRKSQDKGD